jgi:HD-like signal output (HDOD) protein/GGDEF domain-containing protein
MADDAPALERFVDQAGPLYSLPAVAVEILRLTGQPKVDLAALKQCLLRDPALVGKILRVVNSSLFGLSRGVSDLNQALALLGTKSVRLLVLGFSLPDKLFAGITGDILHRYWHHTAIKATAAREISETLYRLPGEEPFIAGLLQDLGMLVLIQQLGEPYVRFLDRAFAKAVDVNTAETVALGFDHVQLSARLFQRWLLPESLIAAIGVGHSAERMEKIPASQRSLPQILHLADLLAGMLAEGRTDWLGGLLDASRHYHQLSGAQLTALVGTLQEKVDQLAGVLSLELPQDINYESVFFEAHRLLTVAADDAAMALSTARRVEMGLSVDSATDEDEAEAILSETTSLTNAVRRFSLEPSSKLAQRPVTASSAITAQAATALRSAAVSTSALATMSESAVAGAAGFQEPISTESQKQLVPGTETVVTSQDENLGALLLHRTGAAIAACRQARQPLSYILVEIDRYAHLLKNCGEHEAGRFAQLVGLACGMIEHSPSVQLQINDCRFAVLLTNCDRPTAVELGHQLLDHVRRLSQRHAEVARAKLSVSVGVATATIPAKNFSPAMLLDSADRCLHTAHLSGGNTLKSIDVL